MRKVAVGLLVAAMFGAGVWLAASWPTKSSAAPSRPPAGAEAVSEALRLAARGDGVGGPDAAPTRAQLEAGTDARRRGSVLVRVTLAPDGSALSRVAVRAHPLDGRAEELTRRVVVTDASWLAAQHPTFGTSVARMVRAPADATDVEVRVIELHLDPGGAFLDLRVTSETGVALAGAEAMLQPVDRPSSHDDGTGRVLSHLQRSARTEARGLAQLGPLTRGDYRLIVRARGFATEWQTMTADGRPRLSRDVVLAPEARVHGRVLGSDGTPVAGITVHVVNDSGGASTDSDRDGNFALSGLAAGPAHWLTVHPSIARVEGSCTLVRGESTALAITLAPTAQIAGRVVDEVGRGLAGWRLSATAAAGGAHDAATDADGVPRRHLGSPRDRRAVPLGRDG